MAISLGLLVGAIAVGATWWFLPQPKFVAMRRVRVLSNPDWVLDKGVDRSAPGDSFQRVQIAYLTDRLTLNQALNKVGELGLQKQENFSALEWVESHIKVEFTSPEIMQVSITGDNPTELSKLVDAVVETYLQDFSEEKDKEQLERLKLLRDVRTTYQSSLEGKRKFIREMATSNPLALQTQHVMTTRELGNARTELSKTRNELKRMKVELDQLLKKDSSLQNVIPAITRVEEEVQKDLVIKNHQANKDKLHEVLVNTLAVAVNQDSNRTIKKIKEDIELEQGLIDDRRKDLAPSVVKKLQAQMRFETTAAVARLQEKISYYDAFEKELAADVTLLQKQVDDLGHAGPELREKDFNLTIAEDTVKKVEGAVNALEVEMLNKSSRIRKWDDKAYSKRPDDFLKRASISGVAGLGGFAFILLAVAFLEFRSRKIDSSDEVVYGLGMPLVGTLPCMPSGSRRLVGSTTTKAMQWKGMLTESIDAVRTLLLHAAQTDSMQIVMVTSAVGGEGKTSLSCHLAASLARSGRKTLLVDSDMRNPSCHRMFDVELESGLAELLRGEIEVADAIHSTPAATLSVIPAGQCDAITMQSLAQGGIGPIFSQLRQQFDFIVVDSCPVLPVADSLLIGQQADAVVFSILRDVSRMPKIFAAYQRLAKLGVRMLGAVVNGTNEAAYGADYHYIVPANREQAAV
ncbi:MAG: polysaccharide biosynthesis tyrosine autokinase [Gemmataceae bacterium]